MCIRDRIKPHKASDIGAAVFCVVIAGAMILFFAVALFASLIKLWPYNLTFTLSNYDLTAVAAGNGGVAFKNSIMISLLTAFLGTILTFTGAYLIDKMCIRDRDWICPFRFGYWN